MPMNISNYLRTLLKHLRFGVRQNPTRDWFILLIVSAIALVGIIAWNVWTFELVVNGSAIGAPAIKTASVPDQSSLDAAHTILESRSAEELKYKTGAYHYTDPSQ